MQQCEYTFIASYMTHYLFFIPRLLSLRFLELEISIAISLSTRFRGTELKIIKLLEQNFI